MLREKVHALLSGWSIVRQVLWRLATEAEADTTTALLAERAVASGLERMRQELTNWTERHHTTPEESSELIFHFPRTAIGVQLRDAIGEVVMRRSAPCGVKARFVETASRVMTELLRMATNPQEEELWQRWREMEVVPGSGGALGQLSESFGKQLHLRGAVSGEIQVMQDWEWPWMYALADLGFKEALASLGRRGDSADPAGRNGAGDGRVIRVLEVGWGQGISGRRLMDEPLLTGAAEEGVTVVYEVVELHPVVAEDARKEAQRRPAGCMLVHEGPWEKVMPALPDGAYDLLFWDPFLLEPKDVQESQRFERWGLPKIVLENLLFYRLLRTGGVVVQYALSHGFSTADILRDCVAPLYSALKFVKVEGLATEEYTNYVTQAEACSLEVPALIK